MNKYIKYTLYLYNTTAASDFCQAFGRALCFCSEFIPIYNRHQKMCEIHPEKYDCTAKIHTCGFLLDFLCDSVYDVCMEFAGITDIAIYGTDCVADISRGTSDVAQFISAKEKFFDVKVADGTLTVTQKTRNIFYRIIMRRFEFKIILPKGFRGRLRFRNNNGGLYLKGGDFSDVELATKNGKFELCDANIGGMSLKMSNGTLNIKSMNAYDSIAVKCQNGNIKAESVSTPSFNISCTNASLSAIDIKAKKFDCSTSNGTIDASGIVSDDIRLETSNGKITAMPLGTRDDYKLSAETSNGLITIDGVPFRKISDVNQAAKLMSAKTSNGEIDIRFV